ncbi:SlyX family protein [Salinicola rhizosphaerae]|nr:SlyX family protein [Salinicola rhizosphaerae]
MESRLEAVESRLAFQEDWLETLDQLLRDQAGEGERTRQLIALLRERLVEQRQAIDDLGGDTPSAEDERPPHY